MECRWEAHALRVWPLVQGRAAGAWQGEEEEPAGGDERSTDDSVAVGGRRVISLAASLQ